MIPTKLQYDTKYFNSGVPLRNICVINLDDKQTLL